MFVNMNIFLKMKKGRLEDHLKSKITELSNLNPKLNKCEFKNLPKRPAIKSSTEWRHKRIRKPEKIRKKIRKLKNPSKKIQGT